MTEIGLMSYYLGIEVKQTNNVNFFLKKAMQRIFSRSLI